MEDLYTYLGYILIAILLYLIGKTILAKRLSLSLSKEGFMGLFKEDEKNKQEKNDTISELKTHIKYLQDDTTKSIEQLNLSKNRKLWEELIIAMEDRINCASLQSVASVASMIKADPENEKLLSILGNLNELNKYKDTLRDNMKYLDGLK
jgi:hypothetical protein